jgi:hypothetical protein
MKRFYATDTAQVVRCRGESRFSVSEILRSAHTVPKRHLRRPQVRCVPSGGWHFEMPCSGSFSYFILSTTNSATSFTWIVPPSALDASFNIVMQNGHPTATVLAPVSLASL